jgi:hypothetical protein
MSRAAHVIWRELGIKGIVVWLVLAAFVVAMLIGLGQAVVHADYANPFTGPSQAPPTSSQDEQPVCDQQYGAYPTC